MAVDYRGRNDERRHGQHERQCALSYIDTFLPDEDEVLGALAPRSGSSIDESALNPVPSDGGIDL